MFALSDGVMLNMANYSAAFRLWQDTVDVAIWDDSTVCDMCGNFAAF